MIIHQAAVLLDTVSFTMPGVGLCNIGVRNACRTYLGMFVATGAPKEASLARRTLVLRLRVHLHVLREIACLIKHLTALCAREAVHSVGSVDVRMRHELSNVLECSVAFETAQNVAACRPVMRMMLQTRLTARKRLVAQRTPVGIPVPVIYLNEWRQRA